MDVSGEISELMDPLNPARDERREERLLRMSARTKAMPVTTYNKFSEARSVSFCSKRGKKWVNESRLSRVPTRLTIR